jgi:hypothetical protein
VHQSRACCASRSRTEPDDSYARCSRRFRLEARPPIEFFDRRNGATAPACPCSAVNGSLPRSFVPTIAARSYFRRKCYAGLITSPPSTRDTASSYRQTNARSRAS